MINLKEVSKRYTVDHVPSKWILQNVSLVIPPNACVGVIGNPGSGKTTLLRLIAGTESPTEGKIVRNGRISTPASYSHGLLPALSGRQNAKFICRINGYADDIDNRLLRVERLAGLGEKFDKPMQTYTQPMKASLSFALSMALDFDMYISDGFNFAGIVSLKDKGAADAALQSLTEQSGLLMTAKGAQAEATLKRYCKSAIWLHEGNAKWFDDINEAFDAFRASQPPLQPKGSVSHQACPVPEQMQPIVAKIKQMQNTLTILNKAVNGQTINIHEKKIPWLLQVAKNVGMELVSREQVSDCNCRLKEGMIPILRASRTAGHSIEYFDLKTQCEKIECLQ